MTKYDLIKKLEALERDNYDPEKNHLEADNLLLEYIADKKITSAFKKITKWYA